MSPPLVLVVDDDPLLGGLVMEILSDEQYCVLQAEDAGKALQIAESNRESLRLLITDIKMPGTDGTELAAAVQRLIPEIRVLFMSGLTASGVAGFVSAACPALCLAKPFTPVALIAAVESLLDSKPGPDSPGFAPDMLSR